jgi:hypothetical protein
LEFEKKWVPFKIQRRIRRTIEEANSNPKEDQNRDVRFSDNFFNFSFNQGCRHIGLVNSKMIQYIRDIRFKSGYVIYKTKNEVY